MDSIGRETHGRCVSSNVKKGVGRSEKDCTMMEHGTQKGFMREAHSCTMER
jgi:hypothetical protein